MDAVKLPVLCGGPSRQAASQGGVQRLVAPHGKQLMHASVLGLVVGPWVDPVAQPLLGAC